MKQWAWLGIFCAVTAGASENPPAVVRYFENPNGIVIQSPSGGTQVVATHAQVPAGSQIHTGPKARIDFELADGSSVRIGANTLAALMSLRMGEIRVDLREGALYASVRPAAASTPRTTTPRFTVRTARATMGVRGTEFTVLARDAVGAVMRTISGMVEVSHLNPDGKMELAQVRGGHGLEIHTDGSSQAITFDPAKHADQFFLDDGLLPSEHSFLMKLWLRFKEFLSALKAKLFHSS